VRMSREAVRGARRRRALGGNAVTADTVNSRALTQPGPRREFDRPRSVVVNTGRHAAEAPVNTDADAAPSSARPLASR